MPASVVYAAGSGVCDGKLGSGAERGNTDATGRGVTGQETVGGDG
jgi:hypothetical protein